MIKANIFTSVFFIFFFINLAISQDKIQHRVDISDVIIEGKVISKESVWNESNTGILTKNTIEIYKNFKGETQSNQILVFTEGGMLDGKFQIAFHTPQLGSNMEGIIFLQRSVDNNYKIARSENPIIEYKVRNSKFKAYDGTTKYNNPRNIYSQITDLTKKSYTKIAPNSIEKSVEEWLGQNFSVVADTLITFSFDNVEVIGTTELEFDIMAHSTEENIKFAKSDVYISYSTEAFGNNVVANDRIEANKETIIENNVYTLDLADEAADVVKFLVNAGLQPDELYPLSLVSEKFLHIRIDIENIYDLAQISFDASLMENESFFYNEATGEFVQFDQIRVDPPVSVFVDPQITMLAPNPITAGTGDILTITGNNFGNFDPNFCPNCKVKFANGDLDGFGEAYAQYEDIITWTDQEITVRVPSATNEASFKHPAASGGVWVERPGLVNPDIIETSNEEDIHILYSVLNFNNGVSPFVTKTRFAISNQTADGIIFQYHNNVNGTIQTEFRNAVGAWCNETSIAWKITSMPAPGDSDASTMSGEDGVNLVMMKPPNDFANPNAAAAVVITGHYQLCGNGLLGALYISDVDIKIRNDYNANELYKVYNYILHELGHAHGLNHSKNPSIPAIEEYIMNSTANNWPAFDHDIQPDDAMGANTCFNASMNLLAVVPDCNDANIGVISPIAMHNCGDIDIFLNSTAELGRFVTDIQVSPNPVTGGKLMVDFIAHSDSEISVSITNSLGESIFTDSKVIQNGGNYFEIMLQDELSAGIYFLSFKDAGSTEVVTYKFIKI